MEQKEKRTCKHIFISLSLISNLVVVKWFLTEFDTISSTSLYLHVSSVCSFFFSFLLFPVLPCKCASCILISTLLTYNLEVSPHHTCRFSCCPGTAVLPNRSPPHCHTTATCRLRTAIFRYVEVTLGKPKLTKRWQSPGIPRAKPGASVATLVVKGCTRKM